MRALGVAISICTAGVWLLGCQGGSDLPRDAGASPDHAAALPAVDWQAESSMLATAPVPAAIEPELWQRLTTELAAQLANRSASQGVKPLTHTQFTVTDFTPTRREALQLHATWSYRNPGDYDQNGEVNSGDLTYMAKHYRKTTASPDWAAAQMADGNGNGEVEFGDVTTLGQNYKNAISGYFICVEWGDIDHNGERNIADISPLAAMSQWSDNLLADGDPILFCPNDTDTAILKTENYSAPDGPGPWFPLTQVEMAAGNTPVNGGPLQFAASLTVERTGQPLSTLTDRRFCLLPYYANESGARTDFQHIPPRVHPDLGKVRSFMYQLQNLENQAEVDALAASPYDLLVIEPTATIKGLEAFDMAGMVAQLKASPGTNVPNKIVLAYLNIGQAEDYRTYWDDATWQPPTQAGPGTPDFIITNDPAGWPGNYPVAFWDSRWQDITYSGEASMLDYIQAAGFDGVYLDWVEAYEEPSVAAAAAAAGKDPAREMAYFIRGIRDSARWQNDPDFIVIQQGAPWLLSDAGRFTNYPEYNLLLPQTDGVGLEDIWFGGDPAAAWGDPAGGDIPQDPTTSAYMQFEMDTYRRGPDNLPGTYDDRLLLTIDYCLDPGNAATAYASSRALGFVPLVAQISLEHLTTTPPPSF